MPGVPVGRISFTMERQAQRPKYSFSSTPRTLPTIKSKYRDTVCNSEDREVVFGNIQYDRRVIRGSTIAQHHHGHIGPDSNANRIAEARRRTMARRRAQEQAIRAMQIRVGTPPPVQGRKHEDAQTEVYLEEIFDHPKEESVAIQTEPFLDRPETPPFVPAKTGVDVSTQIEAGELFDFDLEVAPILEVLVGKTVEQALVEVMEEDELAAIKEQQRRYREIRAAEKAEELRLEEEDRRRREEKERRVAQHIGACRLQKETEERVAAAVLSTGYIADLLPSVLTGLKDAGYLVDEMNEDVVNSFLPWVMEEVKQEMQRMVENRDLLSEIVKEVLETRAALYAGHQEDQVIQGEDDYDKNPLPDPDDLIDEDEKE